MNGVANTGTLADVVIRRCKLAAGTVAAAREAASVHDKRLELVLSEQNIVSPAQMALAIAEYLSLPAVSLRHFHLDERLVMHLPEELFIRLGIVPLAKWDHAFAIAVGDPFNLEVLEEAGLLLGTDLIVYVAPVDEVERVVQAFFERPGRQLGNVIRDVTGGIDELEFSSDTEDMEIEEILDQGDDVPVVRIVNSMMIEAVHRRASDIHIEPTEDCLIVRYRIDGVLYDEPSPPRCMQWAIISRLKIIANLDIAERRLPQDGRFTIHAPNRDVDVRLSLVPTVHGQKAVLRILDKANLKPNIASLGLETADYENMEWAIRQPSGLILVTGPTGSGKTTTLYSTLQELNSTEVNIVTVEDPVEYRLPRINQIQANSAIGLTFANGLRSILRQDPDIVLVGEIRDRETATIAIQAALTGHLVLSTLHTISAAGAITRLVHMGVESFLIASSLVMAQAQRIYRKLCPLCKEEACVSLDVLRLHNIDPEMLSGVVLYRPQGCIECGQMGFYGRDIIMETLLLDDIIRDLIVRQADAKTIRDAAIKNGMVTLQTAGLQRACQGLTSIEEVLRVVGA